MVRQWRLHKQQKHQQQEKRQQIPEQFTCVGARCHIFPPKALHLDLDLAWSSAEARVEETAYNLKEAIQMIEEDSYTFGPRSLQSSLPKKKLFVKKLLDKLLSASSQMHQLQSQFAELKESLKSMHEKLRATETAHMEVLHQMEAFSTDQTTRKQDNDNSTLDKDQILHHIQVAKNLGLHELPEGEGVTMRPQSLESLRSENRKLKQDIHILVKDKEANAAALEAAERNSSCALEVAEKHKEVIARITADNMLFLMKLKQTEENLQAAKNKQEDVQKQLEFYRSTWLEEASAEIEDAVKGSLDKAQACEVELQKVRKQQESRMRECENKVQGLTDSLNNLMSVKKGLEERLRSLEEERTTLLCRVEKEVTERRHVETESRGFANTIDKTNRELAKIKDQYDLVMEEMRVKSEDLDARQGKENQLLESLESISSQLEVQRVMNSSLMKKKEEVEWICLEAQAEREKLKQQLRELVSKQT